ncbi:MAG: twin-arginine translocase TatA/TatE family subunit [Nitrospirales bacterium]|nr:twin-arginine translocase TatA/TatE family subunit [Nitrospirales bacterium]
MIGSFGWMELLLILFIVLIIFGAGKIPQLGEGLGKAIKGFKKSVNEADAMDVTPAPEPTGSPIPTEQLQEQPVVQATAAPASETVSVGAPPPSGPSEAPPSAQPPTHG